MGLRLLITLLIFSFTSCKEFYDEEFLEDDLTVTNLEEGTFEATLSSTDAGISSLSGTATIDVQASSVEVQIDLNGIPQNFVQFHYKFLSGDCSSLSFALPNDGGDEKKYSTQETLTPNSLSLDLKNSGAGSFPLIGKSIVIKAFTNLAGEGGVSNEAFTIACGLF